jgi:hypothetical protein
LFDSKAIEIPPAGAGPFRKILPVIVVPPVAVEGSATIPLRYCTTLREFVRVTPP